MKVNKIYLETDSFGYLIQGSEWTSIDFSTWTATSETLGEPVAVVSDFGVNADFRQVYGDAKYSKFLLQKELRESGEAVSDSEILVHKSSKQDQLNTRMFYSLVSKPEFKQLHQRVEGLGTQALLFSSYELYSSAVSANKIKEANAFIFVFPGNIDVAIVNNGVIESFESLSGYSSSELVDGLYDVAVNALSNNISTQERLARVKLSGLCIFEFIEVGSGSPWAQALAKKTGLGIVKVDSVNITVDGKPKTSSIAPLFKSLSVFNSLSSVSKAIESFSRYWLPAVACFMAVVCIGLFTVAYNASKEGQRELIVQEELKQRVEALQKVEPIEEVDYKHHLEGVESILQSGIQSSYFQVINTLAELTDVGNPIIFDLMDVTYPRSMGEGNIEIDLIGFIDVGWHAPLVAFDKLNTKFATNGFIVKESTIDVIGNGLNFAYRLEMIVE